MRLSSKTNCPKLDHIIPLPFSSGLCDDKALRACFVFISEGIDIPDDCPLTLPTNPSLYRQLVQYFRQYFGTPQVEVGEETEEETISFIMEGWQRSFGSMISNNIKDQPDQFFQKNTCNLVCREIKINANLY